MDGWWMVLVSGAKNSKGFDAAKEGWKTEFSKKRSKIVVVHNSQPDPWQYILTRCVHIMCVWHVVARSPVLRKKANKYKTSKAHSQERA